MPRRYKGRETPIPKLCQKLRRRLPTLADATDAEIQHFRRWPTPTDARKWLPKQARYRAAPRPVVVLLSIAKPCVRFGKPGST